MSTAETEQNGTPTKELPGWAHAFLEALSINGVVSEACDAANVGRTTAYTLRQADPSFFQAWQEALDRSTDSLIAEAIRRGRDGVNEPVVYQGQLCVRYVDELGLDCKSTDPGAIPVPLTINKRSDGMLKYMLDHRLPQQAQKLELSGPGSGPIPVEHSGSIDVNGHLAALDQAFAAAAERMLEESLPEDDSSEPLHPDRASPPEEAGGAEPGGSPQPPPS